MNENAGAVGVEMPDEPRPGDEYRGELYLSGLDSAPTWRGSVQGSPEGARSDLIESLSRTLRTAVTRRTYGLSDQDAPMWHHLVTCLTELATDPTALSGTLWEITHRRSLANQAADIADELSPLYQLVLLASADGVLPQQYANRPDTMRTWLDRGLVEEDGRLTARGNAVRSILRDEHRNHAHGVIETYETAEQREAFGPPIGASGGQLPPPAPNITGLNDWGDPIVPIFPV